MSDRIETVTTVTVDGEEYRMHKTALHLACTGCELKAAGGQRLQQALRRRVCS